MDLSDLPHPLRLNIGAGDKHVEGFVDLGLEPHHAIQADFRSLPLPDESVDEAIAIHVFEHLFLWDALPTLLEWRRVLKPGARLTLELPEMMRCCRAILEGMPEYDGRQGLFGDPVHGEPLMMHRWAWSEAELLQVMKKAGFQKVRTGPLLYHGRRRWRDVHIEGVR